MASAIALIASLPYAQTTRRSLQLRAAADAGAFDIPAAPILIPPGPWKEIDGSVTAPKGFKAQGELLVALLPQHGALPNALTLQQLAV